MRRMTKSEVPCIIGDNLVGLNFGCCRLCVVVNPSIRRTQSNRAFRSKIYITQIFLVNVTSQILSSLNCEININLLFRRATKRTSFKFSFELSWTVPFFITKVSTPFGNTIEIVSILWTSLNKDNSLIMWRMALSRGAKYHYQISFRDQSLKSRWGLEAFALDPLWSP